MNENPNAGMFNFGRNWKSYAACAINERRVGEFAAAFQQLFSGVPLKGRTFLDIGFGQGLGSLNALAAGARVVACDINPECADALALTARHYPTVDVGGLKVHIGSILDPRTLAALRKEPGCASGYDVVHSWGVLHHTGRMWEAIRNAAGLVGADGTLVIAIYRTHWSSPLWAAIKWGYHLSPGWLQSALVYALYPVIFLAKLMVTRQNPMDCLRGMEFFHNVVDWVGGYPYEHASSEEIGRFVEALGFRLVGMTEAQVPTGCSEFVFRRSPEEEAGRLRGTVRAG